MTDPMIEINRLTEELAVEIANADAALILDEMVQANQDFGAYDPQGIPGIIAQMRRLYHHMVSGAQITAADLGRQIEKLEALQASGDATLAAIQAHHDLKHGNAGGRSAAVLVPGDRALYEAAGVKHAVLGFEAGLLDDVRRGGRLVLSDV